MLTSARLNTTGHGCVAELSDFNFTVQYRPGTANRDVDALSRMLLSNLSLNAWKKLNLNGSKREALDG